MRSSAARVPFAALANLTIIIAVASSAQAVDVPAIPLDAQLALWLDAARITSPDGGPVAGTYATLCDYGWRPAAPDRWRPKKQTTSFSPPSARYFSVLREGSRE